MTKNVIHIVDSLSFSGGVSNFVYDLCKALYDNKVNVIIIGILDKEKNEKRIRELEDYGIQVYCLGLKNKKSAIIHGPIKLRNLINNVVGDQFAVLNLHLKLSVLVGAFSTLGMKNIKCVETYHSQYSNYFLEYKLVSNRIRKYICCSKSAEKEFIQRFNPPKDKICMIQNGIDRRSLIKKNNLNAYDSQGKSCFLSVGRLTEQKNFVVTARAFQDFPDNQLIYKIIGNGPQKTKIADIISCSKNEVLIDRLSREQVIFELRKADMVVIPSLWEGLSIFMLEVMTVGCPMMLSDIESFRDVLGIKALEKGERWRVCEWGYLISINDIEAYREAARHYTEHQELKKGMIDKVRSFSNKYDIENTARQYINVYLQLEGGYNKPLSGNDLKNLFKNIRFFFRDFIVNRKYRRQLHNTNFSIICNDCTAGCIYKDLKMKINSPTRNFYFNAKDYIKFCQNLQYYLNQPLQYDDEQVDEPYLTAKCDDLRLFLVHYDSVERAQEEWEKRKKRVNFDNLYFMMNDRNHCTESDIKAFDELPYKNKVCFTHIKYPEYKSTYYIPGNEDKNCVDTLSKYVYQWWVTRYYDYFDFVSWLNKNSNI